MKYAEVYPYIKTSKLNNPFDYIIPDRLSETVKLGNMVIIPFGKRQEIGFITGLKNSTDINSRDLKPIDGIVGNIGVFNKNTLELIYWMSSYYFQPFGKITELFLPPGKKEKIIDIFKNPKKFFRYKNIVYLSTRYDPVEYNKIFNSNKYSGQKRIIEFLKKNNYAEQAYLFENARVSRSSLSALYDKGLVKIKKTLIRQHYEENLDVYDHIIDYYNSNSKLLDSKNEKYLDRVKYCISNNIFKVFTFFDFKPHDRLSIIGLLVRSTIENKKKVLILAPEIFDSKRLYSFLYNSRSQKNIAIYHSGLKESEKLSRWYDIYSNRVDIIVGNRSALFLPIRDIGLILIDEQHNPSYKEISMIRYNTGDVAEKISKILRIPLGFISNTPSMRLWYNIKNDISFELVRPGCSFYADNKVSKETLDLKNVDTYREDINITKRLYQIIDSNSVSKAKTLIFINKRGYSNFLICKECNNIPRCPRCNIPFSYHKSARRLICHHCSYSMDFDGKCNICGSKNITTHGTGIQKIELKLKKRFQDIDILRIDSDMVNNYKTVINTRKKLNSDQKLIVVGTQKVLRNFDIKNLTSAVIIDYDKLFMLPDFHINERIFQVLIQILSKIKNQSSSKFLIQTHNTDNKVLKCFVCGDFEDFYKMELDNRKDLYYPPYSRLINIIVSGKNEEIVKKDIRQVAERISGLKKVKFFLLGPAPAPFNKIKLFYRWHILIKTDSIIEFNNNIKNVLENFKKEKSNKIIFDIDPICIL